MAVDADIAVRLDVTLDGGAIAYEVAYL